MAKHPTAKVAPSNTGPALGAALTRLSTQLPLLDAVRAGSELYGAPRLNAFMLFEPNENSLSRIVEDFLDPLGSHGQGTTFLNALLREVGLSVVSAGDPVRTRREAATAHGRRIDLVIETPKLILGFENKPWAAQQPDQLHDYLNALKSWARGRQVALIFLSDQEPQTAKEEVFVLPFAPVKNDPSLTSVLQLALEHIKAARTRVHVDEFITYIDWQFGDGAMIYDSDQPYIEAVKTEFQDSNHRKSIAAVLLAARQLHADVLNEIGASIMVALKVIADDFTVVDGMRLSDQISAKHWAWEIRRPSWPANLTIAIDANRVNFGQVAFGVRAPDPKDKEFRSSGAGCPARTIVENALKSFPGGGKTRYWPWWKLVHSPQWGPEFAASVILHSPTGRVEDHPEIAELRNALVEIAFAVDKAANPA